MAGQIASLFKSPQLCRLSGVSLQARSATEGPEFLYAAVYFHTMTSLVPDDFGERWRITECTCHISLTQHDTMPRYDDRTIYNLRQAFQRWQSTQNSVEATLQYIPLEERIDPQCRIVLSVFPDEQSPLFKLLGQLHDILFEKTTSSCHEYHVSVTEPGEIKRFRDDVSAASPPQPVVSSLEPQSPTNRRCLQRPVSIRYANAILRGSCRSLSPWNCCHSTGRVYHRQPKSTRKAAATTCWNCRIHRRPIGQRRRRRDA